MQSIAGPRDSAVVSPFGKICVAYCDAELKTVRMLKLRLAGLRERSAQTNVCQEDTPSASGALPPPPFGRLPQGIGTKKKTAAFSWRKYPNYQDCPISAAGKAR